MHKQELSSHFYKENIILIIKFLALFFIFSFIFGIFLEEYLNKIEFFGTKLGYFLSNQGVIYINILLIFFYIKKVTQLEKKYEIL